MRRLLGPAALLLLLGSGLALAADQNQSIQAKKQKAEDAFEKVEILQPGERVVLKGEIFYSKPLRFDYDKDGTKNRVVMPPSFSSNSSRTAATTATSNAISTMSTRKRRLPGTPRKTCSPTLPSASIPR